MEQTFSPAEWAGAIKSKLMLDGISEREGARRSGVAVATFNRSVRGMAPSVETFARINKWLSE